MARAKGDHIWVWLDDPAFGPLQHIGTLSRGDRGSVRFAYEPAWLRHAHAFPLDPELDLFAMTTYAIMVSSGLPAGGAWPRLST